MSNPASGRHIRTLLFAMTTVGLFIVFWGLVNVIQSDVSSYYVMIFEMAVLFLFASPWSVRLPSGATWRTGLPLVMLSMFVLPPTVAPLVAIPGLIFNNIRTKSKWWKYLESISHVAIGLTAGAGVYRSLFHLLQNVYLGSLIAAFAALTVHLVINRLISVLIVAHNRKNTFTLQFRLMLRELHWGYLNSYLVILLATLVTDVNPLIIQLLTFALLFGMFHAVSYYSRVRQLQEAVLTDGLTGVENRSAWDKFASETPLAGTSGSVAVIDINGFKSINDEYGHHIGDVMIRDLSHALHLTLPPKARLFRYGGDEFIVHFPKQGPDEARAILNEAVHDLGSDTRQIPLFMSIGIAQYPQDSVNLAELFRIADSRMYHEKKQKNFLVNGDEVGVSSTVLGLIVAIESRDRYTAGHNIRVAFYALKLAEQVGLESQQLKSLFRATLVHDIGKIGVPDYILNNPGALSDSERKIIEQHPQVGYDMCAKLGFKKEELDIILLHHEKWDGTGYPKRLASHDIPRLVRIVTIADVYDALTSERSYRQAWSHEDAMRFIISHAGKIFDPALVSDWVKINKTMPLIQQFPQWTGVSTESNLARQTV